MVAIFRPSLTELEFFFDVDVQTSLVGTFDCGQVFEGNSSFGTNSYCLWKSSQILSVFLTSDATVNIGFKPSFRSNTNLNNTNGVSLQGPPIASTPVANIDGPTLISCCQQTLKLTGVVSGNVGFYSYSYNWVISSDSASQQNLQTLNTALPSNSLQVSLNTSLFTAGVSYSITLTVTNFLNFTGSFTNSFLRSTSKILTIDIKGENHLVVYPDAPLVFYAVVLPDPTGDCFLPINEGDTIQFAWSLFNGPSASISVNTAVTSILNLPPGTLDPGNTYVFRVQATVNNDLGTVGYDYVTIEVLNSPLVAGISSNVNSNRFSTISLSAYDYLNPYDNLTGISFSWDCFLITEPSSVCPLQSQLVGANVSFLAYLLAPGDWVFTLNVTSPTNYFSTFQIPVHVEWASVAEGEIHVLDIDGSGVQAHRFKQNPTYPLVLNLTADGVPLSYNWTEANNAVNLSNTCLVPTQSKLALLYFEANSLQDSKTYTFQNQYTPIGGVTGSFTAQFVMNERPRGGSCKLTTDTEQFYAFYTNITISCTDFIDDSQDLPLSYMFYWVNANDPNQFQVPLVTAPVLSNTLTFFIPGSASNFGVLISDSLGAQIDYSLSFPLKVSSNDILSITNGGEFVSCVYSLAENFLINRFVKNDDIFGIQQSLYSFFFLLADNNAVLSADDILYLRLLWEPFLAYITTNYVVLPSKYVTLATGLTLVQATRFSQLNIDLQIKAASGIASAIANNTYISDLTVAQVFATSISNSIANLKNNIYYYSLFSSSQNLQLVDKGQYLASTLISNIQILRNAQAKVTLANEQRTINSPNLFISVLNTPLSVSSFPTQTQIVTPNGTYSVNYTTEVFNVLSQKTSSFVYLTSYVIIGNPYSYANSSDVVGGILDFTFLDSNFNPLPLSDLNTMINILFPLPNVVVGTNETLQCVSWNISSNSWSSKGCTTSNFTSSQAYCQCNHATSYSVRVMPLVPLGNLIYGPPIAGSSRRGTFPTFLIPLVIAVMFFIAVLVLFVYYCVVNKRPKEFSMETSLLNYKKVEEEKPLKGPLVYDEDDSTEHLDKPTKQVDVAVPPKSYYVVYEDASSVGLSQEEESQEVSSIEKSRNRKPENAKSPIKYIKPKTKEFVGGKVAITPKAIPKTNKSHKMSEQETDITSDMVFEDEDEFEQEMEEEYEYVWEEEEEGYVYTSEESKKN